MLLAREFILTSENLLGARYEPTTSGDRHRLLMYVSYLLYSKN
ncbi:hypothetical protein [Fischerella thermalis]|nr:hypothetical protein [Fischerella thermalis]